MSNTLFHARYQRLKPFFVSAEFADDWTSVSSLALTTRETPERRTKRSMETIEQFLERKYREIQLISDGLSAPQQVSRPRAVDEVIATKFQLTAALRAEHELQDWNATETAWSTAARPASGQFLFQYDYQRADLCVSGPPVYEVGCASKTVYSASGMGAISALLLASGLIFPKADILVLPGSYGETLELVERLLARYRLVRLALPLSGTLDRGDAPTILLLDSCVRAAAFDAVLRCDGSELDLLVFDTTCFASSSGRIRRVLRWARRCRVPVVMVRSHNKLDTLGAEYGRLGSSVFVNWTAADSSRSMIERLAGETRNAVRLLGSAALPAHFPPYVGSKEYRDLTRARIAAILRNGRLAARILARELPARSAELHFVHGLYVTLYSSRPLDELGARQAAEAMSGHLRNRYPIRHAGSFGFDFAATEWFRDATQDRFIVRVAVPDLPTQLWTDLVRAIAVWWNENHC
ncbi:hypothetical protein ABID65_008276 [Bradyrhizobium sp. S3.9.2]